MGQKVNPIGIRLGIGENWRSFWYANNKEYSIKLHEDITIRSYLYKKLSNAFINCIRIERPAKNAKITICTARPGIIIGKRGEDIEFLRKDLSKKIGLSLQIN